MGYLPKVIKGVGWMGALNGFNRLVGYVRIAILARLLNPLQFGVYGVASLALSFLEVITDSGINVFFVQREGKLEEYVDSAWLVSIARGLIIFLILFLGASPISTFFKNADAKSVLMVISLVPLVEGFFNPSSIKYRKNLKFKNEFFYQTFIYSIEAVAAIILAFVTKSAISLALALLVGAVTELILSFILFLPRPRLKRIDWNKVRHVLGRGKWTTLAGFSRYLFEQGDDIVVGKILGTFSLGLYQVAYRISSLPLTEITAVFRKVTFPVYVEIRRDMKRLKKAFLKTTAIITLFSFLLGLVIFLFPETVIRIVLGPNWLGARDVLKILAVFGFLRSIFFSFQPLFMSLKKQEYVAKINLVTVLGMFIFIFPLVKRYGILGAGYSAMLGLLVGFPFLFFYTFKAFKKVQ